MDPDQNPQKKTDQEINELIELSNTQMENLKKEIEVSPLISTIIDIEIFKAEFSNHPGFLMKIQVFNLSE